MRTTMDIDEHVLSVARSLARAQRRSVGSVLPALARKGLRASVPTGVGAGGFPVFPATPGGRPITSGMVRAAQDDD